MKKALFMTTVALGATAFIFTDVLAAQDASRFNGTWKGEENGQIRELTYKDGVVHMREQNANGLLILRQYPAQGQEVTMTEGVWNGSKAVGKMEGNKLVVDTVMANGTKWHDEWTMAADGKSYSALRQLVAQGEGGVFGKGGGGGAPKAGDGKAAPPAGGKGGGGKGKGGGGGPEVFHRVQ